VEDRATVELPDGDQRQVPVMRFGTVGDVRFTETTDPGLYRIRTKDRNGERTLLFAALAPFDDSDLSQLTDSRLEELEKGLRLKRIDPNDKAIATAVAGSREGYDLWPWALGAVMLLAATELGLARRWSRDAY
jgi:hypothetical protein